MASLIANKDAFQISTGNDADSDRHGIVTPDAGLMNPNRFLSVAIQYLYASRPGWPDGCAIGKTGQLIHDRPSRPFAGRKLIEVPSWI